VNFFRVIVSSILFVACFHARTANGSAAGTQTLRHDAYVWQRVWNEPVRQAVVAYGTNFSELIALHTEVSWKNGRPDVVRVPINWPALTNCGSSIGLALRIGPFSRPFATNDSITKMLLKLASSMVAEAKTNGVPVRELQLDFDCAESKLEGYRLWVQSVRQAIAPVPLTITALPSWLKQPAFERLVSATDGYVLQVHSLEKPNDFNAPFTLCDPVAARVAVERAGRINVPFRVALPTYGYLIAFNSTGRFMGLSAEGPLPNWGTNVRVREVRSDPLAMAELVQFWTRNRPASMCGVIWYRLPTIVDNLNWRWPTLGAIVGSRSLRESFRSELRRVEPGLVEINLVNNGELDLSSRLAIELRWQDARLVAGDALRGFEMVESGISAAKFQTRSPLRLMSGDSRVVGWLRFDKDCEVQIETKKF
jgi:hypothetical protein